MPTRKQFLAALLLLLATPSSGHAHAHLRRAEPAAGATIRGPVAQVEIAFSEAVEFRFSVIAVTDAAGTRVDKQDLHAVSGDAQRLAVGLGPLLPGVYKVAWQATSVDTHKTEGSYTFTIAP